MSLSLKYSILLSFRDMTTGQTTDRRTTDGLHWLKAAERTDYKLALLVYKCRQGVAPPYLADELCQPADTEARCRLRSASTLSLIVRHTRLQPSVTELFQSLPLVSGTVFCSTSRQHHHWPSFAVASRLIASGAAFYDFTVLMSCPRSDMSLRTR